MPEVIDWRQCADRSVVHRIVEALAEGQLVVFPTETVYGIAASVSSPIGLERLAAVKGREDDKPFTLAIAGPDAVTQWLPHLGVAGRRLANRCWPGPITIVSGNGLAEGAARQLAEPARRKLCPNGTLGIRVPAHEAILSVLCETSAPLALSSANKSGEPDTVSAEDAVHAIGNEVDLIIADGPCRFGKPSTVVRVEGDRWEILREGALPSAAIQRLASCVIVFVCTGNTCRSPLAEALFKMMLAKRLECGIEDLAARGSVVRSAGLYALPGELATGEANQVAKELGANLDNHVSQPLSAALAAHADHLVVMTRAHLAALEEGFPNLGATPRLLCSEGEEIADPIGTDRQTYQKCARQIQSSLERFLAEVEPE